MNLNNQTWLNDVATHSSCRTYRTFKTELKLERYLLLPDSADRINICRLRCRKSKIPVFILGYAAKTIPYENRKCSLCNLGDGDEFHHIFNMPYFSTTKINTLGKMASLRSCKNKHLHFYFVFTHKTFLECPRKRYRLWTK